jgi:mono/diheme cytochrome c family protein
MKSTFLAVPVALLLAVGTFPDAAQAHPIVAGFERFHAGGKDPVPGGQLLLGELNCTSCHASESIAKKQAPNLDQIGTRANIAYLQKYLNDPHAVKPGTTMPDLFANDPEKASKVEALTHLLASTGALKQARPDLKAVIRGKDIYTRTGCAACHGARDVSGEPAKTTFPFAIPLGELKAKYAIPGLATFLANPLAIRSSGRMPHLLKPAEANDVANYLLQGVKVGALPTGKGTTRFSYFEGDWQSLPDFDKLKAKAQGAGVAFDVSIAKKESNYALRFEGVFLAERAGEYRFHLTSDDGSRLLLDGKRIVNNDGIHPATHQSGAIEVTKGLHKLTVDFFQGGGEAVLEVEIEGPGLGRQALGPLVAATEAELNAKAEEPKNKDKDKDAFVLKPELVEKGKQIFVSVGCANCHPLNVAGKAIASSAKAKGLDAIKKDGCLSEKPAAGLPDYHFTAGQRQAITDALQAKAPQKISSESTVHTSMLTLNCYACHSRNKVGGPTELTNPLFLTTQQEMGDEGRVPPPLDGVGAKLNAAYANEILDKGAHDRPYMHTQMPGFGSANVGNLFAAFETLDSLPVAPKVAFKESDQKIKASGRSMVGAQTFGCVKCHTFAGNKAEGVQGIDMTLMTKRLKHDWFYAYLIDPQKVRPGTRMPTAWPNGQSVLPDLLDGKSATQIEAIWVYLKDGPKATLPAGLGKKFIPLMPLGEAIVYRNFIQGAGSRAIGVGYPEKLNLAFDANELRLAMIWQGGFIDAARHWTDRGVGFEGPLGDNVVNLPSGAPFAVLESSSTPWPAQKAREAGYQFLGYKLTTDERPTFRYAFNGVTVEDFPNPIADSKPPTLQRTLTLTAKSEIANLAFRAAVAPKITAEGDLFKIDTLTIKAPRGKIRTSGGKDELIVPVTFKEGKTTITLLYQW